MPEVIQNDSDEVVENQNMELPIAKEFFLETPLYRYYNLETTDHKERSRIWAIEFYKETLDCWCPKCQRLSIFQAATKEMSQDDRLNVFRNREFQHEFLCTRCHKSIMKFHVIVIDGMIGKIGQYPSMADLAEADIQKYRKILEEEEFKELSRAVGLVSHGIGIGAFVYLRRIFERLIEEAHQKGKNEKNWDEDAYEKSRIDEKIGMLKSLLPAFLVENKILYSILSKAIHELSEQDCLRDFNVVKLGIEFILDEKIDAKEKEEKIASTSKEISRLHERLKGK